MVPWVHAAMGACCVSLFHTLFSHAPGMAFVGREGLDTLGFLCTPATSQKGSGPLACSMLMHLQHCLGNLARRFPETHR
jgi:hypothetical protein